MPLNKVCCIFRDNQEVAVVYFRTGYTPDAFPDDEVSDIYPSDNVCVKLCDIFQSIILHFWSYLLLTTCLSHTISLLIFQYWFKVVIP